MGVQAGSDEVTFLDYQMQKWPSHVDQLVSMFENHNKVENSEYLESLMSKLYS